MSLEGAPSLLISHLVTCHCKYARATTHSPVTEWCDHGDSSVPTLNDVSQKNIGREQSWYHAAVYDTSCTNSPDSCTGRLLHSYSCTFCSEEKGSHKKKRNNNNNDNNNKQEQDEEKKEKKEKKKGEKKKLQQYKNQNFNKRQKCNLRKWGRTLNSKLQFSIQLAPHLSVHP